ncbi:hypothetical protein ABZT48_36955 [Streptomyces avermitilis]|uniref:hypothetical protein n=1 Tax=Streptomyces avermitilis TaxID=33903 RepID=UPI0033B6F4E4
MTTRSADLPQSAGRATDEGTYTVRYSRGHDGHGTGSLTAGHSVQVKKGMAFDAYRTSRS